ncbi:MAG: PCRF domain-containing protein, partial [Clostridia bacterium]|nr:PCRF domain-containing protein [Clostridia bacterium]
MFERLKEAEKRYEGIEKKLSDPSVVSDINAYRALMKEYKELTPVMTEFRRRRDAEKRREEASLLCRSDDPEMRVLAAEEFESAEREIAESDRRLTVLLLP